MDKAKSFHLLNNRTLSTQTMILLFSPEKGELSRNCSSIDLAQSILFGKHLSYGV